MKQQIYRCVVCILAGSVVSGTAAFAGYWEQNGTCAIFEKTPIMRRTHKLAEGGCTKIHASGTGVFQQDYVWSSENMFSVTAENYPDTEHLEYNSTKGPAFYSGEELYDYKSCYITPQNNTLRFYCFRADDE